MKKFAGLQLLLLLAAACGGGSGSSTPVCVPGQACVPTSANACMTYVTECNATTGATTCVAETPLADGDACGTGKVCLSTSCIDACVPGVACTPSATTDPCKTYATACSNRLTATSCSVGGDQPDGTACGSGLVCSSGTCTAVCASGLACSPVGPADPCKIYTTTCTSTLAQQVCAPTAPRPNGTPCGTSSTCQSGVCVGTLAPPTLSPPGGTGAPGLVVTLTAPDPSATIYYTTDGSVPSDDPTLLSATFLGAGTITLQTSTVVQAFAKLALQKSPIVVGVYTITAPPPPPPAPPTGISLESGFTPSAVQFNGSATLNGTRLRLTPSAAYQVSSAFFPQALNVQTFTTEFTFQLTDSAADGITFTLQRVGPYAIGSQGGGLGYGPDPFDTGKVLHIERSVAVKFDTFDNEGEGTSSTGVYLNGATPTIPATDLTPAGIFLRSGHLFHVRMVYDGAILSLTVSDVSVEPPTTFSTTFPVDIPGTLGDVTGYVGFTGSTGEKTAIQEILDWTYVNSK